mmetsp:Transcript_18352/g.52416  ORF Transcript_18352/g.52416 Transcript_18352/m.52416 type:complete len:257 (-) Transcript_18352:180-950(-)
MICLPTSTSNNGCSTESLEDWRSRSVRELVARGVVAIGSLLRNDDCSDDTTTGSIARDCMRARLLGKRPSLGHRHTHSELSIQQTLDEDASRSASGDRHLQARASQADVVDGPAFHRIPASDDDSGAQVVLVVVDQTTHQMRCHLHGWLSSCCQLQLGKVVPNVVCQRLSVGSTSASAAIDVVGELRQFVVEPIGNVCSHRCASISAHDHSTIERKCQDGRSGGHLAIFQSVLSWKGLVLCVHVMQRCHSCVARGR